MRRIFQALLAALLVLLHKCESGPSVGNLCITERVCRNCHHFHKGHRTGLPCVYGAGCTRYSGTCEPVATDLWQPKKEGVWE